MESTNRLTKLVKKEAFGYLLAGSVLVGLVGCAKPSLEECSRVQNKENLAALTTALDNVLHFLTPKRSLSEARDYLYRDYSISYLECAQSYAIKLEYEPVPELGFDKAGRGALLLVDKRSFEVGAIYAEGDNRPLPSELYSPMPLPK